MDSFAWQNSYDILILVYKKWGCNLVTNQVLSLLFSQVLIQLKLTAWKLQNHGDSVPLIKQD